MISRFFFFFFLFKGCVITQSSKHLHFGDGISHERETDAVAVAMPTAFSRGFFFIYFLANCLNGGVRFWFKMLVKITSKSTCNKGHWSSTGQINELCTKGASTCNWYLLLLFELRRFSSQHTPTVPKCLQFHSRKKEEKTKTVEWNE